jgi:hypothetical protein
MATTEEPINPQITEPQEEAPEEQPIDQKMLKEIRASFLSLKISVCVQLNKKDVASFNSPSPYYVSPILNLRWKCKRI